MMLSPKRFRPIVTFISNVQRRRFERLFRAIIDEGKQMNNSNGVNRYVQAVESLMKLFLLATTLGLLALYIFALPLGIELFLFENLSSEYSSQHLLSLSVLNIRVEVTLGQMFVSAILVYAACFILSWKTDTNLSLSMRNVLKKPLSLHLQSSLLFLPVLSSLTYLLVVGIHFIEEASGIPVGEPLLPVDPLMAYYALTVSPLVEEIIYRILPIGMFLAVRLLAIRGRRGMGEPPRERLKLFFLSFLSPKLAKRKIGLKTFSDSGVKGGIETDEWLMVTFTSIIFSFSHYFSTSTWEIGKIVSSFIQGFLMAFAYLMYGAHAPIILHWFFNYYLYTYSLATFVHSWFQVISSLNEMLIWSSGFLGLTVAAYTGSKWLLNNAASIQTALLFSTKQRMRELVVKCNALLSRFPRLVVSNKAITGATVGFLLLRLAIIGSPGPELGEKYFETGFVFDESYYVNAARKMFAGEAVNNEHPPLAKALIMLGIALFGDNPIGWRIFPILTSIISMILIYYLTLILCGKKCASFSAALLFASDIMAFNVGQIGILDAPSMMFVLSGGILVLKGRSDIGGLLLGLAFLSKLSATFTAAGILLSWVLLENLRKKSDSTGLSKQTVFVGRVILVAFVTFLFGLWVYDATYNIFNRDPFQHLSYMYNYHRDLTYGNSNSVILPLEWINPFNPFPPIAFHIVTVTEVVNRLTRTYHPIAYYGIYTPLWWSIWVIMPVSLAETVYRVRKNGKHEVSVFSFPWIVTNYFTYVVLGYLMQRWVYPFYFYMTLPGLYIAMSDYLTRSRCLRIILAVLICVQLFWFFVWFPVKPKIVTDLLLSLGLPA